MDMATALAELGVTGATLDADAAERLDRDGYAPLPGILDAAQLEAIRARLAELLAVEGDQAGLEVHQEAGTDRLADLVNKGEMFRPCFTDPRLLACIDHVLGDFKLSSLNFRAALPGQGHQNLHTDWGGPVEPGAYQVCNSVWLLDDFTADNGATRVVPGSHRFGNVPRLALHSYFTRREHGQQLDQKKYIRPQTMAVLSPAARFILDV
jgi:Phytanoyl-CoA dioxygenase (PhyH)